MLTENFQKVQVPLQSLNLIRRVYNNCHEHCINQKKKYWCLIEITVEKFYDVIFE